MSQPLGRLTNTYVPAAFAALLFLQTAWTGCSSRTAEANWSATTYASMAPSNTELIYAIGAQDGLVAVCTQCDYPEAARKKAKIGSFTTLNLEEASMVRPQAVFLVDGQEQLSLALRKQPLFSCKPIILHSGKVLDIATNTRAVGRATGHSKKASEVADKFESDVKHIRAVAISSAQRPRIFLCVWPQPLTTVGAPSYLNDAIVLCGGTNIAGDLGQAYPQFNLERLLVAQPDVIILPHEAQGQSFYKRAPWTSLKAVANGHLYFLPERSEDRLSRPTLRLTQGLAWLATKLHPDLTDRLKPWLPQAPAAQASTK